MPKGPLKKDRALELRFGVPGSQLPSRDAGRLVREAEEMGFDSMWWADRLMGWMPKGPHALLDPFVVMSAVATATSTIQLGTAVADPLRRHPTQLAQTALSLQQISSNRLLLGIGPGEAAGTRPYGISFERPVGRFEEAIQIIRGLWTGKPYDFEGEHYQLQSALCGLGKQVPTPPLWVAAHGYRTLGITGRFADGWIPTGHGAAAYADQLRRIRDVSQTAGRPSDAVEPGVFAWLVAAESEERAHQLFLEPGLRSLGLLLPQGALPTSPLPEGPWKSLIPTDPDVHELVQAVDVDELSTVIPHGTPDDIAAELMEYVAAGARHLVLCDMSPASGARNGLEMRPIEIHQAVREALERRVAHCMIEKERFEIGQGPGTAVSRSDSGV